MRAITVEGAPVPCPGSGQPADATEPEREVYGYRLAACAVCGGYERIDEEGTMADHYAYLAWPVTARAAAAA